jgi:succinyl-diaminopimelate desuccinylase
LTGKGRPITPGDDEIARFLAATAAARVAFLRELVRLPSDNPPGDCAPHAKRAAHLLGELGLMVESHPVPAALCRANGMISATNLVVRRRFGDGPVIALNAHGDVVAPGAGWTRDPYGGEIVDGWLYGRGAAVSKSDFATYAFALMALEAAPGDLKGTVELHFTYDEEVGGAIGPRLLLEQGITRPDFAISAGFSHAVVTAHNGCLHLEVTVSGRSAHAARPETGRDALAAATAILAALYAQRAELGARVSATPGIGSPTLNVGLIEGGINTNVVPDRVAFRLDRRIIPEESPAEIEADLRAYIFAAIAGCDGITVDIERIMVAAALAPVGDVARLSEPLVRHASARFGERVACIGSPLYTDARHYAAAGIPTVLYGAGPHSFEDANAHRADERLPLDDLHGATEVVARALCDILA